MASLPVFTFTILYYTPIHSLQFEVTYISRSCKRDSFFKIDFQKVSRVVFTMLKLFKPYTPHNSFQTFSKMKTF